MSDVSTNSGVGVRRRMVTSSSISDASTRRSPIHDWLLRRTPQWRDWGGMPTVGYFESVESEAQLAKTLGLCDVSGMSRHDLRGPDAESWLQSQGWEVPVALHESTLIPGKGRIIRLDHDEFLIEGSVLANVEPLSISSPSERVVNVFHFQRQDATFLLTGGRAIEVFAQTCGVNISKCESGRVIFSRIAGINASIFPDKIGTVPVYWISTGSDLGWYLWETLIEIVQELDGRIIGMTCLLSS